MSKRHHTNPISKFQLKLRKKVIIIKNFQKRHNATDSQLKYEFQNECFSTALRKYFMQRDGGITI